MRTKPVLWRENTRTILSDPSPEFGFKRLCDGLVFNLGDACAFSCEYCYVKGVAWRFTKQVIDRHNELQSEANGLAPDRDFHEVVIRRADALQVLEAQLTRTDGTPRYDDSDRRVVFTSSLVDVAANMELLRETADACNLILEKTGWQIRLLSKSSLLAKLPDYIAERHHGRLIFGFSTGTLDDRVSRAIESGSPLVSQRLKALHALQDSGFRTFGMICPSLPQSDYEEFSRDICASIRVDKCEHVWAEPLNVRAEAMPRTIAGLVRENLGEEAAMLSAVHGPGKAQAWEHYARETFLAHTRHVPASKLRFLQYVDASSAGWWSHMRGKGALLLGSKARMLALCDRPDRSAPERNYTIPI